MVLSRTALSLSPATDPKEVEVFADDKQKGMNVHVVFNDHRASTTLKRITEVHWLFPSGLCPQVAIESNIDSQGQTVRIADIERIDIWLS